jgi:hypothetical protein
MPIPIPTCPSSSWWLGHLTSTYTVSPGLGGELEASLDAGTVAWLKREADDVGDFEFVLNAELTDTAGVVVATTHGTYQVRRL